MDLTRCLFDRGFGAELLALQEQEKFDLIRLFWPETHPNYTTFDACSSKAVLSYISEQLSRVVGHGHEFAAQNFQHTCIVLAKVQQNGQRSSEDVAQDLRSDFPDSTIDMIRRSIELTTRIWLTINIHSSDIFIGPFCAGDEPIDWPLGTSLEQLLQGNFRSQLQLSGRVVAPVLDPSTTLAYLVVNCGLRVLWTDDISSHLRFNVQKLEVRFYRHKACITNLHDVSSVCPISKEVISEILDTMDLFLPPWDPATNRFLRKEGQESMYTLGCRKPSPELDISRYDYFGHRIQYLLQCFNRTPRTWKQLALDRRNKLEWSAFWVTVMVAILTLVSIPCNIIQATYSVKAYNAALAQGAGLGRS